MQNGQKRTRKHGGEFIEKHYFCILYKKTKNTSSQQAVFETFLSLILRIEDRLHRKFKQKLRILFGISLDLHYLCTWHRTMYDDRHWGELLDFTSQRICKIQCNKRWKAEGCFSHGLYWWGYSSCRGIVTRHIAMGVGWFHSFLLRVLQNLLTENERRLTPTLYMDMMKPKMKYRVQHPK